jgi:UPF0755 protein
MLYAAVGALVFVALTLAAMVHTAGGGGAGAAVEITLPATIDAGDAADLLASRGLIRRPVVFAWYLRLLGDTSAFQPGSHLVSDNLAPADLQALLARAPSREKASVTLPEGWTRFQAARRLEQRKICTERAFLAATADPALLKELGVSAESLEGYLFPATYNFPLDSDAREIARSLKQEFDRRLLKLSVSGGGAMAKELGWGLQELLTLASVIEREAAVDDERPLMASAFYNRFRDPSFVPRPPRLQSDATTAYGCLALKQRPPSCNGYTGGKISPEMNQDPANLYSTYAHGGLPPGPIASPGERSLQAAISPADTPYFYFVGKGGGRHTFSATLAEHNAAVKRLRELRAPLRLAAAVAGARGAARPGPPGRAAPRRRARALAGGRLRRGRRAVARRGGRAGVVVPPGPRPPDRGGPRRRGADLRRALRGHEPPARRARRSGPRRAGRGPRLAHRRAGRGGGAPPAGLRGRRVRRRRLGAPPRRPHPPDRPQRARAVAGGVRLPAPGVPRAGPGPRRR